MRTEASFSVLVFVVVVGFVVITFAFADLVFAFIFDLSVAMQFKAYFSLKVK